MIFLDTNVVVWLAADAKERFSKKAEKTINQTDLLLVSPMVRLELQYLFEIKRINSTPEQILKYLQPIGVTLQEPEMLSLIDTAMSMSWTRDPFDRLITAQAAMDQLPLLTKDNHIREHYSLAVW